MKKRTKHLDVLYYVSIATIIVSTVFVFCSCMPEIAKYDLNGLCILMESTIGKDRNEAEGLLEGFFNSELQTYDIDSNNETNECTYDYKIKESIIVDGMIIDNIVIACDDNDGQVLSLAIFLKNTDSVEKEFCYHNYCSFLDETYDLIECIDLGDDYHINRYRTNNNSVFSISIVDDSSGSGFWLKCSNADE